MENFGRPVRAAPPPPFGDVVRADIASHCRRIACHVRVYHVTACRRTRDVRILPALIAGVASPHDRENPHGEDAKEIKIVKLLISIRGEYPGKSLKKKPERLLSESLSKGPDLRPIARGARATATCGGVVGKNIVLCNPTRQTTYK